MRSAAATGLAVLVMVAGCGGGLSGAQRDGLKERLEQARAAAADRDGDAARTALARFRVRVRAARDDGALSKADADRLIEQALAASRRARAELTPEPTATAAPTAAPTLTPAPPPPKPPGKAKGKKDKPGKGGKNG